MKTKQKVRTPDRERDENEIKRQLQELGVDIMEPETRKEETMSEALRAFSSFVLYDEKTKTRTILDKHLQNLSSSSSMGELAGWNSCDCSSCRIADGATPPYLRSRC
mmetsp:Transcript_51220/g.61703  ORF Transcript_51220/g.61703 Transcript_51220/m.61703 type:complete len:107 (+) Transcript_51220:448-768(+)